MEYQKLCDSDYRFMLVVWEHAPVNSGELVKICQQRLGWKKSTTYTAIKKMSAQQVCELAVKYLQPDAFTVIEVGKLVD